MSDGETIDSEVRNNMRAGKTADATAVVIRTYGAEVMGLLVALSHDEQTAAEVYALWCERLWKGLPSFRFEASVRTWAYVLARRSLADHRRAQQRKRREVAVSPSQLPDAVVQARSATCSFLRTSVREELHALRESLSEDDRILLALRLDRQMAWLDITRIVTDDPSVDEETLQRAAPRLRKRFQRLKARLTEALRAQRAQRNA